MKIRVCIALLAIVLLPQTAWAQHACQFYAQNPSSITVDLGSGVQEREVEIDFTNTGTSTWQNTGGVTNLNYIELRGADNGGNVANSPLYHSSWINRQRVGSFLAVQNGVAPKQVARFVFKISIDPQALGIGSHDCYFRPYHAQGGYIYDWGWTKITVKVVDNSQPPPGQGPAVIITSVSPAGTIYTGVQVTVTGSATMVPLEYRWRLNNQVVSSQATFQNVFYQSGSYTIGFSARNQYGWSNEVVITVPVQDLVIANPAPGPLPSPDPAPVISATASGQSSLTVSITAVNVERSVLRSVPGTGSYVTVTDYLTEPFELRKYHILQLRASVAGGVAKAYEWSLAAGGVTRVLGTSQNWTTKPDDLFIGEQQLRFRAQDESGRWSGYSTAAIKVVYWPQLFLPVHGQWSRNGNDYNEDDHRGEGSIGAQDWNASTAGDADFGLELVASFSGTASSGTYSDGGNYVIIESNDTVNQIELRAYYMHLSTVLVRQGQTVVAGQPIGLCGDTGSASLGTHLHYVVRRKENGNWKSVIPEPCWRDTQTVLQTIAHDQVVWADHRVLPSGMVILPETVVSAPNWDEEGWGHHKAWAPTTDQRQPTAYAIWDTTIPISGTWRLWTHNPTAHTHNSAGASTHNTTARAMFEIARSRQLGLDEVSVNQDVGNKGSLMLVMEFKAKAGDMLKVRQHNATGESDKEISFDELVLTLEQVDGTGGSGDSTGSSVPQSAPVPTIPSVASTPTSTHASSPSSPPALTYTTTSSGGGGCAISSVPQRPISLFVFCSFLILLLSARKRVAT